MTIGQFLVLDRIFFLEYNIIDYYDFEPWSSAIAGIALDGEMYNIT